MPTATTPPFEIKLKGKRSISLPLNLLQTSVFPVILIQEGRMRSVGTCFAISNHGLCLTAKHVIDDIPFVTTGDRTANVDGNLGILYLTPPTDGDLTSDLLGGFIPMNRAHTVSGIDIAVMHLNLPVNTETGELIPFPLQRLRLDFPKPGERLIALGYEKGEWSFDDPGVHTLSQTFTASTGFAGDVHPHGRDSVVLPTPCFQMSVPARSGMSGGPVIDETGMVVGVVSTSFELNETDDPISYAAPLAASMGISVQGRDDGGNETTLFLWDFAKGAMIVDQGSARIERTERELSVKLGNAEYRALLGS